MLGSDRNRMGIPIIDKSGIFVSFSAIIAVLRHAVPFEFLVMRKNHNSFIALFFVVTLALGACDSRQPSEVRDEHTISTPASMSPVAQTTPTMADGANDTAILINAEDQSQSLILGSGAAGGLELYSLDGERVGVMQDRPIGLVDVRYNFPFAGDRISLIVAYDIATTELVAYRLNASGDSVEQISSQPIAAKTEIEGMCLYHSPLTGKYYAFAAGGGYIQQWEFFDNEGDVAARQIRNIPVGAGAAHCAVSDRDSMVYYSQETVGVWKLAAEPETEAEAEAVDFAMPHGQFTGDIKGVAVYEHEEGGYLLVSDADVSRFQVYDLSNDEHLGSFSIDTVEETEGITATSMSLPGGLDAGLIVVADDDNDGDNTNYKIVGWNELATGLGLSGSASVDPTLELETMVITVTASVETEPVNSYGDAADDPAIWVHPERPELSVIIGSQKQRGIDVFALDGSLLQSLNVGRINNIDIRYGFELDGKSTDIVAGSNRTTDSLGLFRMDPYTRTLEDVADGVIPTGMGDPYGLCMYHSPVSGDYFVFVNDTDGIVKQFKLSDNGSARIGAEQVREFSVGSQTEGCVADDETGDLYVGEENVAIWKYSAEPDGGDARTMVDNTTDGNITADVEGLALYYGPDGSGYLLASNQGADSYAVYERANDNQFMGLFHVISDANTGIDGASETDGLDVTSANLGPAFPNGLVVVQDGRNITPAERQNFKLVPWERIANAMGLDIHNGYDPRSTTSD
jgi:3-phytase